MLAAASATLTGYLLLGEAPAPTPRIPGFQTERKDSHLPTGSSDRVPVVIGWQRPTGSSSIGQVPAGLGSLAGEGWPQEGVCKRASTPSFPNNTGLSQKEEGSLPPPLRGLEVEALPRNRGAGAARGGPPLEAWHWCQSRLTSAPENHCVRHFQIHGH